MANRKAIDQPIWLVIMIVVGLLIFALVFGPGLNFVRQLQNTISGTSNEAIGHASNELAKACAAWMASDTKQDPNYILGGMLSQSLPEVAKAAQTTTYPVNCLEKGLYNAAINLRSGAQIFRADDNTVASPGNAVPNWTTWQNAMVTCQQFVDRRSYCLRSVTEGTAQFSTCMNGIALTAGPAPFASATIWGVAVPADKPFTFAAICTNI